jgi:TonB family protein
LIHFDFEDRYQDELVVGTAITRREAVLMSVVVHGLIALSLFLLPQLPVVQELARKLELRREQRQAEQAPAQRPEENRTFVFVQPRVDLEAARPPARAELSDKDRVAQSRERAENPTNTLPYARGNSPNRVEAAEMARARGPESPAPPAPGEQGDDRSAPDASMRQLPAAEAGLTLPRESSATARAGSGALGEALRNLQRYVEKESFDNPQGGNTTQFGPHIQFDTKGVEFGPWVRRFVAQVKRNWFIPYAAMTMRGHVVLQFNIHKDGRITDLAVVGPSSIDAFNNAAANAIITSNPTEPLPPEYPSEKAFFTVTFYYNEEPTGQ